MVKDVYFLVMHEPYDEPGARHDAHHRRDMVRHRPVPRDRILPCHPDIQRQEERGEPPYWHWRSRLQSGRNVQRDTDILWGSSCRSDGDDHLQDFTYRHAGNGIGRVSDGDRQVITSQAGQAGERIPGNIEPVVVVDVIKRN